jgi:hypothetical protein
MAVRPGCGISYRSDYGFAADAAERGRVGGGAGSSSRIGGGGSGSIRSGGSGRRSRVGAGAGASVLLPQALSTNAATKALKAKFGLHLSIPQKFKETFKAERVVWASLPKCRGPILECFAHFHISFP